MSKTPSIYYENMLPPEDHPIVHCYECGEETYPHEAAEEEADPNDSDCSVFVCLTCLLLHKFRA